MRRDGLCWTHRFTLADTNRLWQEMIRSRRNGSSVVTPVRLPACDRPGTSSATYDLFDKTRDIAISRLGTCARGRTWQDEAKGFSWQAKPWRPSGLTSARPAAL